MKARGEYHLWITETGRQRLLTVQLTFYCPVCDPEKPVTLFIPGHHIPVVQLALAAAAANYPELVGRQRDVQILSQMAFGGEIPERPEDN